MCSLASMASDEGGETTTALLCCSPALLGAAGCSPGSAADEQASSLRRWAWEPPAPSCDALLLVFGIVLAFRSAWDAPLNMWVRCSTTPKEPAGEGGGSADRIWIWAEVSGKRRRKLVKTRLCTQISAKVTL